jgi:hypothetical protein
MSDKRKAVFLEVKNCNTCPNHTSERFYTGDSFEMEFTYKCKAKSNKTIGIFDWQEERNISIPTWCPLRKE